MGSTRILPLDIWSYCLSPCPCASLRVNSAKGLFVRRARSFASLRMTARTPLKPAHGKPSLHMSKPHPAWASRAQKAVCPHPAPSRAGHDPAENGEKTGGQEPHSDQSRSGLLCAKRTAMGAVRWNCKASSNRPAISTSQTAAFPTPMKKCKPSPCSRSASCPTRETMAASMVRRIGSASMWRGAAAISPFALPDEAGIWTASWTEPQIHLPLPDPVVERLQAGERSRANVARDRRTRRHALRRPRSSSSRFLSLHLPDRTAGAARSGMGLGSAGRW